MVTLNQGERSPQLLLRHDETGQPRRHRFFIRLARIHAIGVVKRRAVVTPKPDVEGAGANWNDTGWFRKVESDLLSDISRSWDYLEKVLPLLPPK